MHYSEPINKSIGTWIADFQQGCQEYTTGKTLITCTKMKWDPYLIPATQSMQNGLDT
jgi:hypothetical protein